MTGGNAGEHVDGRFVLLDRLGSGGMGTVWRARDLALEREVALKEVRPPTDIAAADEDTASRKLRERVLREARALARINHPSVVTIHHIVDVAPHPWLVMELVPGGSLQDLLRRGPLPPQKAARIGREVLSGLRAAHDAGIHHRDVKPANVLLRPDGSAVLTDFGIAALRGSTSLTATGELVGSPEYVAPERVRSAPDHPAADLWSLGVLLYTSVEGHSPLRRETGLATLAAVLEEPVPPPVRSGPLTPVLAALLVRDPAARPDAAALDDMLERVIRGIPLPPSAPPHAPTATPVSPVAPPPPVLGTPPPDAPTSSGGPMGSRPTQSSPTRTPPPAGSHGTPRLPYQPSAPLASTAPPRERNRAAMVIGAGVAVLLLLAGIVGVAWLASSGGGKEDAAGKVTEPSGITPSDDIDPDPVAPTEDDPESPAPEDSTASSDTPDPDRSPAVEEITTPSPTPPSTKPKPPREPALGWVAQLFSEPVTNGTAARDKRLAAVREDVPRARVLRSDDYASLNPGYWVIYAPGAFADGKAAVRFCADRGRTNSQSCVGRYISDRAADRVYVCHPSGGAKSRCTRT